MTEIVRVIRMCSVGSEEDGMGAWNALTHANILTADAKDRTHQVFNRKAVGNSQVRVGVWEALPYREKLENYPCDEFMYVIQGSCKIVEEDGKEEIFVQGESFFMPRGFNGYWVQTVPMRKYYMIVEAS